MSSQVQSSVSADNPPYEAMVQSIVKEIGRAIPKDWGESERRRAQNFLGQYRKSLRRVARAAQAGNLSRTRREAWIVGENHCSKFLAAVRILRKRKPPRRFTYFDALHLAHSISMNVEPRERVKTHLKREPGHGPRRIVIFGVRRRTQQILARDLLRVHLHDCLDFAFSGGRDAAVRQILHSHETEGYRWYLKADIKSFFDSISHRGLEAVLPLPKRMIRAVITPEPPDYPLNSEPTRAGEELGEGPRGIPQGSIASNDVASFILRPTLSDMASNGSLVLHRDDMLGGAQDEEAACHLERTLKSALRTHPCGPFSLKTSIAHHKKGCAFLGYYLQTMREELGGDFRARASYDARDKMRNKLASDLMKERSLEVLAPVAWEYFYNWLASFSLWPITENELEELKLRIACIIAEVTVFRLKNDTLPPYTHWEWSDEKGGLLFVADKPPIGPM